MTPKLRRGVAAALALASVGLSPSVLAVEPGRIAIPADVPPVLHPWAPWVLKGHEIEACPFLVSGGERPCVWPGALELTLDEKGGRFTQRVMAWAESIVPLLGDPKRWPQDVKIDGAPAQLISHDAKPSVLLAPGDHVISGALVWDAIPEALPVPPQTGLLSLTVRGERVPYPTRDEGGMVWLQKTAGEADVESALDVVVHRRVVDEVPLLLITRISLRIAGKNREELLGRALPDGFVPMAITSPLPARIEPNGRLRVQARPGSFTIEITARHEGPVQTLPLASPGGPWADEEVWVFEARPHLRQVVVDGVPALDPTQTTLAEDWKRLPGYRVRPGEAMALVEKQRGDADPAPDRISMLRTLWLDFDGQGYGFLDQVNGQLSRSWRLGMAAPSELGRVSVSGQDVLITRQSAGDPPGIEVRQGQLQLVAEGRIEGAHATLPAVGWTSDFQAVGVQLNLPPGWRLFDASGPDGVTGTWVRNWNLLDLFLLLITALATARLFGWRAGLLALVTLLLVIPEQDSPQWAWLVVLACETLVRLLPEMWLRKLMRATRVVALGVLSIITLVFAIHQIRTGLFPVLERPWESMGEAAANFNIANNNNMNGYYANSPPPPPAEPAAAADIQQADQDTGREVQQAISKIGGSSYNRRLAKKGDDWGQKQYRYEYDVKTTVQTGKGLARWSWNTIPLRWSNPVERSQTLTLYLMPPALNTFLAFLRVLLAALLLVVVSSMPGQFWPDVMRRVFSRAPKAAAAAVVLALAMLAASPVRAQPAQSLPPGPPPPDNELLDQLRQRLLAAPPCFPECASLARMSLEAGKGRLKARLEAQAQAQTGVPLPGSAQAFVPEQVLLDGRPATLRRAADGVLWILVPAGTHEILLDGPLPPREIVQLPLPMRPHRVEAHAEGYTVEGIHEDGLADDNLQLTRVRTQGEATAATLAPGQLPSFVRVERTLALGLTWQATTRVVRLTPPGSAVVLEIPLLPGEQVTTADVRVAGGKALVNMAPQATEVEWRSALDIKPAVELKATSASFIESWRLEASPVWHVSWSGIPAIHPADLADRTPEWRPWPGESVTLAITRPEAVPGQTLTLNNSRLVVKPGVRMTESSLELLLRSSRGGQHVVGLPQGAELQSVTINGALQPIRQDHERVALPVVPGEQRVLIAWRQPTGIATVFASPAVDVGLQSVNSDLRIEVPAERWILFAGGGAGGSEVGPAVLFWSLLLILLAVALALASTRWSPLRWWSWMLLAAGLTQVSVIAAAIPAVWLMMLEWRRRTPEMGRGWFVVRQVGIVLTTLVALGVLFASIHHGLLGLPDMQVEGNGSSESVLRWFADRTGAVLPQPWMVSVPLMAYRGVMFFWAVWIAWSLLNWLKWGWGSFTTGGAWKSAPKPPPKPAPAAATPK